MKRGESKWLWIYYQLTKKGLDEAIPLKRRLIRGSIFGKFSYGEVQVLNYLRRYKLQPRSLSQIWSGMEFGVTKKEMLSGITKLKRKGYLKKV